MKGWSADPSDPPLLRAWYVYFSTLGEMVGNSAGYIPILYVCAIILRKKLHVASYIHFLLAINYHLVSFKADWLIIMQSASL